MAQWHEKMQDYNFKIVHILGKWNSPADALSRMHQEEDQEESKLTPLIPPDAFLNVFKAGDPRTVEYKVIEAQQQHQDTLKRWEETIPITRTSEPGRTT